jgi:hypothetical protein
MKFTLKNTAKKCLLGIPKEIDAQLITIVENYKKLITFQNSLCECDKDDWGKETQKGQLLTRILKDMEGTELKLLKSFANLTGEFEQLCRNQGVDTNLLNPIKFFKPQIIVEATLKTQKSIPSTFQEIGWEVQSAVIQRHLQDKMSFREIIKEVSLIARTFRSKGYKGVKELYGLTSVRHLVGYDEGLYDVIGMIQSLIRVWGLVLMSNFYIEIHDFIALGGYIEAEMWMTGNFYEGVSKIVPKTLDPKETQAERQELSVIKNEIQDRFKRIKLYFKERHESRDALRCFCGRDIQEKNSTYREVLFKIQTSGDNLLHELYHLGDNVKTYLYILNRKKDLEIMERFKPYRWCASYVNHLKHGSEGKGRPVAIAEYVAHIFNRNGVEPTVDDKLIDCDFMININGQIESRMGITLQLIDMWFQFLRYHSDIDVAETKGGINSICQKEFVGKIQYSAKLPDGILDRAKRQAEERRKMKL